MNRKIIAVLVVLLTLSVSSEGVGASQKRVWERLRQLPVVGNLVEAGGSALVRRFAIAALMVSVSMTSLGCGKINRKLRPSGFHPVCCVAVCCLIAVRNSNNPPPSDECRYGDRVYFSRDGLSYAGVVVKKFLGSGQYQVKITEADRVMLMMVTKDEIEGIHNPDTSSYLFEGQTVVLLGDRDEIRYRHGILRRVYNDNSAEIRIWREIGHDDDVVAIAKPYTIFVQRDIPLIEGGFVLETDFKEPPVLSVEQASGDSP